MKKKVLVLATTFPRWQNDTTRSFVYELERRLISNFDITVLAPHHPRAAKHEQMGGLDIHRFVYFWPVSKQQLCYEGGIMPAIKQKKWLYLQALTLIITEFVAASRLIKSKDIKLIHAHWAFPQGLVALLLNRIYKVPYVVTSHGSDVYGLNNPIFTYIKKQVFKHARAVTAVSADMKQKITDLTPCHVQVLPMGVDSALFNPNNLDPKIRADIDADGPLLLFVGRLVEGKGVNDIIDAMPRIISRYPNVKLAIIGNGPQADNLKEQTSNNKLDSYIKFLGPKPHDQLPSYYAAADIFISPSVVTTDSSEGFGLTLVEAAFCGCIPIGTSVGGITDIINSPDVGLLVPQKNPQKISEAVLKILDDPELQEKMKNNCLSSMVQKYDWSLVSDRYYRIYQDLI